MTTWGPFSITGKNAIITGAAKGIGFGIASRFVEGGANVVLADVDEEAVLMASEKLSKGPGKCVALSLDVTRSDAGAKAVKVCVDEFGSLDILVNNAGIFPMVPMLKMSGDAFDKVYHINLKGLAFMSQAAGNRFVEQGKGGRIVNVASVDSLHPSMVGLAAYDASKGGVLMFTKNFALEMAPHHVGVNAILPGGVTTEGTSRPLEGSGMTPKQMADMQAGYIKNKIPMGRMGVPDDIATAVVFLASAASSYMTGASVVVDGGMLLA